MYRGSLSSKEISLSTSILIDFGGMYAEHKDEVKHYTDLSESGDILEAINHVYDVLRWAETKQDAQTVLITDIL